METISKEVFLAARKCPRKGWNLQHRVDEQEPSIGDRFRMRQGLEIGEMARALQRDGVLVGAVNAEEAEKITRALSGDADVRTIFEATALYDHYAARADMLTRVNGGWHLWEVKSAVKEKKEHLDDLAYTMMVMRYAGYEIKEVSLLLLSRDYRFGDAVEDLFMEVTKTGSALQRCREFSINADELGLEILGCSAPTAEIGFVCKNCEYFTSSCVGVGLEASLFCLPRLSEKKFEQLREIGALRVSDIPEGFTLTENQQRFYDVMKSQVPWVSEDLGEVLNEAEWPVYYLDFETTMTAIPLYPGLAPYATIPTQYSIHIMHTAGGALEERSYLGDPSENPQRVLAEKLIRDLGEGGSIMVYSGYEKRIIKAMKEQFDDLAGALEQILERLFDLEAVIRKHYSHPDFLGRTSIKQTLPVLAPEMSYKNLSIQDGDSAAVLFAEMAQGRYTADEVKKIRQDLLAYCRMDTLGMVSIHEALRKITN